MKRIFSFTLIVIFALLFTSCSDESEAEKPNKIENPVDNYMDSRLNVLDMAKASAIESNKIVEEKNKALETLAH